MGPMITYPINYLHIGAQFCSFLTCKKSFNSVLWDKKNPTAGFIPNYRSVAECCTARKECENEAVPSTVDFAGSLELHTKRGRSTQMLYFNKSSNTNV